MNSFFGDGDSRQELVTFTYITQHVAIESLLDMTAKKYKSVGKKLNRRQKNKRLLIKNSLNTASSLHLPGRQLKGKFLCRTPRRPHCGNFSSDPSNLLSGAAIRPD
jgi:hypothetical protein